MSSTPNESIGPEHIFQSFQGLLQSSLPPQYENILHRHGFSHIAGVDEAGRGPLAGPVVAAAVILPKDYDATGIRDSKVCSAKEREKLYHQLVSHPEVIYAISIVSHEEIDRINILQATLQGMSEAVFQLSCRPSCILVDGNRLPTTFPKDIPASYVVRGDASVISISAASIIAKVTRDSIVDEYDLLYPHFNFKKHKGYGTAGHVAALEQYGPLPIHRKTFQPVARLIELGKISTV